MVRLIIDGLVQRKPTFEEWLEYGRRHFDVMNVTRKDSPERAAKIRAEWND